MYTLYHSPGSCSDGILFLLAEVGADYKVEIVDVTKGMQHDPAFLAKSPKGKVPALELDDGSVLTEFQAIAFWIANKFEQAKLWPGSLKEQYNTLATLDFIVASIHMRGFTFVKVPKKFQLDNKGTGDLQQFGRSEVDKGLAKLSTMLGTSTYLWGDFGLADAAAFYVLKWAEEEGFEIPENLEALLARLRQRPAVQGIFTA